MPTYEYRCKECGEGLEVVQSFSDDPLDTCPSCGGPIARIVVGGRSTYYCPSCQIRLRRKPSRRR